MKRNGLLTILIDRYSKQMTLEELLRLAMSKMASDVHLKVGLMPVIRRHGILRPLAANLSPITTEQLDEMLFGIMDAKQKEHFEEFKEIDLGYGLTGLGRFRINAFKQRGSLRLVIRNIPHDVPTIEQLQLPEVVRKIAHLERGLVLVTGVTGSGKSSTLAAMIDEVNRTMNKHIITIEDPIEFLIRDRKSILSQRELGVDSTTYARALRAALRQDPDVILIGEMRDRETIETALLAAETGHLVLSTLHTMDATETINRVVGAFELHQQVQVRLQLGSVLKAVISQRLARCADKSGYIPAVEVMVVNPRVREMIEDRVRTKEIIQAIEEGQVAWGMQSFDQSLMSLLAQGHITEPEALSLSTSPEDFKIRYNGITAMDGKKWANAKKTENMIPDSELQIESIEDPKDKRKKSS